MGGWELNSRPCLACVQLVPVLGQQLSPCDWEPLSCLHYIWQILSDPLNHLFEKSIQLWERLSSACFHLYAYKLNTHLPNVWRLGMSSHWDRVLLLFPSTLSVYEMHRRRWAEQSFCHEDWHSVSLVMIESLIFEIKSILANKAYFCKNCICRIRWWKGQEVLTWHFSYAFLCSTIFFLIAHCFPLDHSSRNALHKSCYLQELFLLTTTMAVLLANPHLKCRCCPIRHSLTVWVVCLACSSWIRRTHNSRGMSSVLHTFSGTGSASWDRCILYIRPMHVFILLRTDKEQNEQKESCHILEQQTCSSSQTGTLRSSIPPTETKEA